MENFSEIFSSVEEFSRAISERPRNPIADKYSMNSAKGESKEITKFTGTKSFEEADNLFKSGDNENLQKVLSEVIKLDAKNIGSMEIVKKSLTRTVAGFSPIVPAMLSGNPRNMVGIRKNPKQTKVVNLVIDVNVGGSVSAASIITAGAQIMRLIIALEKAGIRCGIYVGEKTRVAGYYYKYLIKLKNPESPLNKLRLIYPIINPSFLRRHDFLWMETLPVEIVNNRDWGSYGRAIHLENGDFPEIQNSTILSIRKIDYGEQKVEDIFKKIK